MKSEPAYYRESGVVPLYSIPAMLLAGVLTAAIISPIVTALTLLFAGCVGVGLIFGAAFFVPMLHGGFVCAAVVSTASATAVRNRRASRIVAIVCTVFAFYLFGHSLLWLASGAEWDRFFELLVPSAFWEELTNRMYRSPTLGVVLVSIFLVIFFGLYLTPCFLRNTDFAPFCEACHKRCKTHPAIMQFRGFERNAFEAGNFKSLTPLNQLADRDSFFRAKLYCCPTCEKANYLSAWAVTRSPKSNESTAIREEEKLVLDLLSVPLTIENRFNQFHKAQESEDPVK